MVGFRLQWTTLATLLMFPVLVIVYRHLADAGGARDTRPLRRRVRRLRPENSSAAAAALRYAQRTAGVLRLLALSGVFGLDVHDLSSHWTTRVPRIMLI
jgi:hypothetical protein